MNKNILYIYLLFIIGLSVLCLNAQTVIHTEGKYTYETVNNDPLNTRIYKLANGLTVYMTVYKNEPRIQTYIAVATGSKKDPPDATGLSHYLEHMLFKGTDKFGTSDWLKEKPLLDKIVELYEIYNRTKGKKEREKIYHLIDSVSLLASKYAIANEYDKMLSNIGAKGTNAYTSEERTVYTNDIPSNQLEKWIAIEAERFRNPVMRLFHTELETVYEEKNISLDDDDSKMWEAFNSGLFTKHPYGTQTVIGSIEHLKNPPLKKVIDYLHTYYVPNNMAICLSGDLDPDQTISWIDEKWGLLPFKPVPEFIPPVEDPITKPVIKEVFGPEAEVMLMGFRFAGAKSQDAVMISIINQILSNGTAGLLDLNLLQKQAVLEAESFTDISNDYSVHGFYGRPREGQSLEELTQLFLEQINELKKGNFQDWLIEAIINNLKLGYTKRYESNGGRARMFVDAFIKGFKWEDYINSINVLAAITKQDVIDFANQHYGNNYVVVYKRKGKDKNVIKIEKPKITPVEVNRTQQSEFFKEIINTPVKEITPVFLDYSAEIIKDSVNSKIPLLYKQNTENNTFNMYYIFEMGTDNERKLGLAISYLEYLGTSKYTPAQMKEEFYKLACSYSVYSSADQVYVSLSGLSDNFEKALILFEEFLSDLQPNNQALDNLVKDILKVRADNKLSQDKILWDAMYSYAVYGPKSTYTNILSQQELINIQPHELIDLLKDLRNYEHKIVYYGPEKINDLKDLLGKKHYIPHILQPVTDRVIFPELATDENKIYVVNYDGMVQSEIVLLSKDGTYNKLKAPLISMYNEYFGSGMSGIVFQELRESKALAYSTFAAFTTPQRSDLSYYILAYIGTQSDKLPEAMEGLFNILNNMPESEVTFNTAKNSVLNQIKTTRITRSSVLFSYLVAQKLGLDYDIKKDVYNSVQNFTLQDVVNFQQENIKDKKYTILVLGDQKKIDIAALEKYGKVTFLSLEEIFGY